MKYSTFFRDSTHILLTRDFISMMKEVPLYHQMNGGIHMNQLVTGKFIALKRKQKNLTQEQLAEKLGVSNKTISKWETGKCMPDYSIVKSLCEELEVTVAEWSKLTGVSRAVSYGNIDDMEGTLMLAKLGLKYQDYEMEQRHKQILKEIYADKKE